MYRLFVSIMTILMLGTLWSSCKQDDVAPKFTVTFNGHGGTPSVSKVDVTLNERVTLPAYPTRNGYDMIGWYWALDTTLLFDYEYARVNSNIELVARWTPGTGQRYTITFFSRGGKDNPLPQSVIANTLARVPLNPYWPDIKTVNTNTFKGWYTDSITFTTAFDLKKVKITGDISLYAKWNNDIKK